MHASRYPHRCPKPPELVVEPVPQRRNVAVLAFAQALFMSIQGMGAAATPLAGYALLAADDKWLATVPVFLMQLGIMVATVPASFLMARVGRKAAFRSAH